MTLGAEIPKLTSYFKMLVQSEQFNKRDGFMSMTQPIFHLIFTSSSNLHTAQFTSNVE